MVVTGYRQADAPGQEVEEEAEVLEDLAEGLEELTGQCEIWLYLVDIMCSAQVCPVPGGETVAAVHLHLI